MNCFWAFLQVYFYLAVYKSQQGEFKGKENNTTQDQLLVYLVLSTLDDEDQLIFFHPVMFMAKLKM